MYSYCKNYTLHDQTLWKAGLIMWLNTKARKTLTLNNLNHAVILNLSPGIEFIFSFVMFSHLVLGTLFVMFLLTKHSIFFYVTLRQKSWKRVIVQYYFNLLNVFPQKMFVDVRKTICAYITLWPVKCFCFIIWHFENIIWHFN